LSPLLVTSNLANIWRFVFKKLCFNPTSRPADYNRDNLDVKRKQCCSVLQFLGAFAKFQKAAIGFAMSVRMEQQLDSQWTDFYEI
jgi:hypothetical protein